MPSTSASGRRPATAMRFAVLRGGGSVEEVAALAVALDQLDAEVARGAARRTRRSGWREAARLEGVGLGELAGPQHLRAARRFV